MFHSAVGEKSAVNLTLEGRGKKKGSEELGEDPLWDHSFSKISAGSVQHLSTRQAMCTNSKLVFVTVN